MTSSNRRVLNIVLALLVALGAWMFVVYNYYPMTDVKYNDVPVSYEGQRELAERGLAVSDASTKGISVRLHQKRVDFEKFTANDIRVTANVSECLAGENDVVLSVSSPNNTSVLSHDTDSIRVTVERTDSTQMDIDVIYSGEVAENEEPLAIDMERNSAEVVCASSKLSSVKRVAAVLDREEVDEGIKSFTATLVALDGEGNVVPYAVIYPEEISLDACTGIVKTVSLEVPVKGGSDEDYDRKFEIPNNLILKGPMDVLSEINSIKAEELNIEYYYEDAELAIEFELPENVILKNPDDIPSLKLKVTKKEKPKTEENADSGEEDANNGN